MEKKHHGIQNKKKYHGIQIKKHHGMQKKIEIPWNTKQKNTMDYKLKKYLKLVCYLLVLGATGLLVFKIPLIAFKTWTQLNEYIVFHSRFLPDRMVSGQRFVS
jgi:hypothetical protein